MPGIRHSNIAVVASALANWNRERTGFACLSMILLVNSAIFEVRKPRNFNIASSYVGTITDIEVEDYDINEKLKHDILSISLS